MAIYLPLRKYGHPLNLCLMAMSFTSAIPFILTLSTLSLWLSEMKIELHQISFLAIITLPYSLKFLWSPLIDNFKLPFFKSLPPLKRIGFVSIIGIIIGIATIGICVTHKSLLFLTITGLATTFFAATHDVIIDTLRIKIASNNLIGTAAASASMGFRIGILMAGAVAVHMANVWGWQTAYILMAICCSVSAIGLWYMPLPPVQTDHAANKDTKPISHYQMYITPIKIILSRQGVLWIILFTLSIKANGAMLSAMAPPFWLKLGYTTMHFAQFRGGLGAILMLVSSFYAGAFFNKWGLRKLISWCIMLQLLTSSLFATLNYYNNFYIMIFLIVVESIGNGLLSVAFLNFLSINITKEFIATQFTLLYSLSAIGKVICSGLSGYIVESYNWPMFFISTTLTSLLCLLSFIMVKIKSKELNN